MILLKMNVTYKVADYNHLQHHTFNQCFHPDDKNLIIISDTTIISTRSLLSSWSKEFDHHLDHHDHLHENRWSWLAAGLGEPEFVASSPFLIGRSMMMVVVIRILSISNWSVLRTVVMIVMVCVMAMVSMMNMFGTQARMSILSISNW